MDVEIAGLTTVTRGAVGAPAETVYERIKMMLKTHDVTMPNPRYVEEVQVDGAVASITSDEVVGKKIFNRDLI